VVTAGGIHGTIAGVKDNTVIVKIADNVKIEVNRSSVNQVISGKAAATPSPGSAKPSPKSEDEPNESEKNG
jgi:preprotein translocase subunit YajC